MRWYMECINDICDGEGGTDEGVAKVDVEDGEKDGAVDLLDDCEEDDDGEDVL